MRKTLSHIFISYCHANRDKLDIVTALFREANLPYWFDESIEAGMKWKPQIDAALEDSYALAVIVTPESMQSRYVTYEWSWALGNGLPVFPMLMLGSYDDVHSRLLDEYCVDCRDHVPDDLLEILEDKKDTPPDVGYLNTLIRGIVSPLRVYIRVVTWLYPYARTSDEEKRLFDFLFDEMTDYAEKIASKSLPRLMVSSSHAFNVKQRQRCRLVVNLTKQFAIYASARSFSEDVKRNDPTLSDESIIRRLIDLYETQWLPAVETLDDKYSFVGFLDDYLLDKKDEKTKEITDLSNRAYETVKDKFKSREEFEKNYESQRKEYEKLFSHQIIEMAYKDKELAKIIWELIELTIEETN